MICADEGRAVSGSEDAIVCVWDLQEGSWVSTILYGYVQRITSVSISPYGELIISGRMTKQSCVWDSRDGAWHPTVPHGYDKVTCIAIYTAGTETQLIF